MSGAHPKAALRRRSRALRRRISPAARWRLDALAQANLAHSTAFSSARRVALYRAFDGEPSTGLLATIARVAGQQVLYARFTAGAPLEFVEPRSWRLVRGVPRPEGPAFELGPGDVVVVPGLAFDVAGHRLGFGAGYYDRTLASCPATPIGLAYDIQRVPALPRDPWDVPVAALATERALYTPWENPC